MESHNSVTPYCHTIVSHYRIYFVFSRKFQEGRGEISQISQWILKFSNEKKNTVQCHTINLIHVWKFFLNFIILFINTMNMVKKLRFWYLIYLFHKKINAFVSVFWVTVGHHKSPTRGFRKTGEMCVDWVTMTPFFFKIIFFN